MGTIAIIAAQLIIIGIYLGIRRAGLLSSNKPNRTVWIVAGLEIALLPILLMLAEHESPKDLHPAVILLCLVTLAGGFTLFGRMLGKSPGGGA